MTGTLTKCLTFAEFEQMPECPGKQELLHGELIELPPPKLKHNRIAKRFFLRLLAIMEEAQAAGKVAELGEVYQEMGYKFDDDGWLVPDVSITHPNQEANDYYLNSPALAVEIISNEKTANHVEGKIDEYLNHGGSEVWVVYPTRRHVWIYRPGGTAEMRSGVFRSALLGEREIDLEGILD
jgi:Uma2 family endonuclease